MLPSMEMRGTMPGDRLGCEFTGGMAARATGGTSLSEQRPALPRAQGWHWDGNYPRTWALILANKKPFAGIKEAAKEIAYITLTVRTSTRGSISRSSSSETEASSSFEITTAPKAAAQRAVSFRGIFCEKP